jgi:hypothetical protein
MKTLQDYINESILDDEDILIGDLKKVANNPYLLIKTWLLNAKDVSDLPDEFMPFVKEHIFSRLKLIPALKNKRINAYINYGYKNLRMDIEFGARGVRILSFIIIDGDKLEVQLPWNSNKQLERLNIYPDLFALLEELKTEYGFQESTRKGTFAQKFKQYSAEL